MTHTRRIVLHWAEQGHIAASDLPRALALAEVLPSREMWRRFLDRLLLWMGTVLVAAGVIFFLACNWKDMGHFAKFHPSRPIRHCTRPDNACWLSRSFRR